MAPVIVVTVTVTLYPTGVMPQPPIGSTHWWELRPAWFALLTAVLVPLTAAVLRAQQPLRHLPAGLGPPGALVAGAPPVRHRRCHAGPRQARPRRIRPRWAPTPARPGRLRLRPHGDAALRPAATQRHRHRCPNTTAAAHRSRLAATAVAASGTRLPTGPVWEAGRSEGVGTTRRVAGLGFLPKILVVERRTADPGPRRPRRRR